MKQLNLRNKFKNKFYSCAWTYCLALMGVVEMILDNQIEITFSQIPLILAWAIAKFINSKLRIGSRRHLVPTKFSTCRYAGTAV